MLVLKGVDNPTIQTKNFTKLIFFTFKKEKNVKYILASFFKNNYMLQFFFPRLDN